MDDILSQIIAYAPDKIDTEIKARALVQAPRNMDQEPRNMYGQGSSVDHAVRTVDPVQDSGNKIEEVLKAYGRYRGSRKGKRPMKFKNFFELYATENFATGGSAGQLVSQLVTPNPDGSRPGYAPQPGWKEEKAKFFKWLADNPDYDFASSSTPEIIEKSGTKFEVGTVQKFLAEKGIQTERAIARTQDKPKYTKKVLEELRKGLPAGISIEQTRPGQYYFKVLLKGKKVNKPNVTKSMVANETNKKEIIDFFNKKVKEYYPGRLTNEEFKDLRLKNKDMKTEDFAKFLESEGKTTYLGEKWNANNVSQLQSKLDIGVGTTGPLTIRSVDEAKKIIRQRPGAKFFLMKNPTDSQITRYAADLVSQEKLGGKGGKKGFPIGSTKENKMFRNFYDSSLKSDGRMKLLTDVPKDSDGNIDWKMKDKNGVHAWKKAKFYDNKTGATYTWGKDYKPGDLRTQVDKAYGKGFFAKSVKTYDDQAKMNKMKFNGKALNEWMREGLLKKELEVKLDRPLTNSKADQTLLKEFYALRKPSFSFTEAHHTEGVGKNPFRMEVSYRAANRKQNNLLNKYKSGTLNKTEYITAMENLSDTKGGIRYKTDGRFIGQTGTPENIISAAGKDAGFSKKQINNMMLEFAATITNKCDLTKTKAEGGRIGFASGSADCLRIAKEGLEKNLFKGGGTEVQRGLIQRIISGGGKMALSMLNPRELIRLSNIVGPGALGLMAAYEAGSITDDVLRLNKPLDEALAGNWLTKSFLPYSEEFAKQKNLLQSGQLTGNQREYALEMMKMEEFMKEGKRIEGLEANKLVEGTLGDDFTFTSDEDMNKAYSDLFGRFSRIKPYAYEQGITGRGLENEAAMNEYMDAQTARTGASKIFGGPQPMVNKAPRPTNMGRGPMTEKGKMNLDFSIPGYTSYDKAYTPSDEEILQIYRSQGIVPPTFGGELQPGEGTRVRMGLASQGDNRSIYGSKFMEGGIASLNVNKK